MENVGSVVPKNTMDGKDVVRYGSRKIPCFLGVYQLTDLNALNIVKPNVSFIVIEQGHAVAVYITDISIDLFDPLGISNSRIFSPICFFLKNHLPCKKLNINSKIQSEKSSNCAKFCLIYLYLRCKKFSFQETVRLFSCKISENDEIVADLFKKYFSR